MKRREDWRILYEIICCAEWKGTEGGGVVVSPGGTATAKRTVTPSKTQLGPDWIYALSPDLTYLAVLQDSCLEIRSSKDNFASTLSKHSQAPGVIRDSYPWLRLLAWSPDSSLLAVAFTNGVLTFFDVTCAHLFSLRTQGDDIGDPPPFSPTSALISMFFLTDRLSVAPSLNCANELITVNSRGSLKCYRQPSAEGAALEFHHGISFRRYYPRGILQVQHVSTHSILIIAGYLHLSTTVVAQDQEKSHGFGLTCWRILHDHPYYRIHAVLDPQQGIGMRPGLGLWSIALSWTKRYSGRCEDCPEDTVCKLRISPDGLRIAAIHESGAISVWHVPSLRPQSFWPLPQQQLQQEMENPYFNQRWRVAFNANSNQPLDPVRFHPFDINWWGNDKIIISRVNGCVTLISVPSRNDEGFPDKNLLGDSPEFFESPMSVVPKNEARGFYALECEIRLGNDEAAELAKGGWRIKKLVTESLFWLMDIERFRPAPKKRTPAAPVCVRTYRFYSLQSITPAELFHRKIDLEEYGDALDLAKLYELDTDLVYQRQWTRTPVSLHSIRDYLSKIKKRNWVLQECLERVPDSIDATRELLEFGLKGTDLTPAVMISQGRDKGRFIVWSRDDLDISESEYMSLIDPENEEVRRLLRYRHQFLHFLDKLQTYELMLGGPLRASENFDQNVFARLRSRSPWESGIYMAKDCDISGLRLLTTRHWSNLAAHYLDIVSSFPETVSPHDYRDFLPSIGKDGSVVLWDNISPQDSDWSEDFPVQEDSAEPEPPMTSTTIETWYEKRIREIEALTGLVNFALDLGRLGLERNVQNLRKLVEDLETVEVLVYQVGLDDMTLGSLESLNHFERLELLMSKATEETFVSHMRHLVLPFVAKCEERIPESRLTLLNQYLSALAVNDLGLVLQVFSASKLEEDSPIISDTEELMALAYNALYACENPKENRNILAILGCIPDRGYSGGPDSKLEALHNSIDELEVHYSMGQLLEKYDICMTLAQVEALTEKDDLATEEFVLNICHSAIRMVPPLKLNEWKALLYDLLELKKKLMVQIPTEKCFELYVYALLRSGNESVINLAKDFIREEGIGPAPERYSSAFSIYLCNIPLEKITEMIFDAAQTYFDSASSYSDSDMTHAKTTLALLPAVAKSDPVNSPTQILLDLIDALKLLNKDFNLDILPQTVRRTSNRLPLIEKAMKNIKKGYRKTQQLLKLSILLRVGEKSNVEEGQGPIMGSEEIESVIMEKCGEAGMEEGDMTWVIQLCHSLMVKGYGVGWGLFYRLAKLEHDREAEGGQSLLDHSTRLAFINQALTLCPQDQIVPLLKTKYLIEIRSLQSRLKELSPSDSEESILEDHVDHAAHNQSDGTIVDDILHKTHIKGFLKTTTSWINPLRDLATAGLVPGIFKSSSSLHSSFPQGRVDAGNEDFEREGYPAFRLGSESDIISIRQRFHSSQLCFNYDTFASSTSPLLPSGNPSPALELCLILHRIWHLERLILGWDAMEAQDPDVVSCLVCDILPEDLSWGLALLLSIEEKQESLRILDSLPPTRHLNVVRLYYLALLIKKQREGLNSIRHDSICYQNPNQLIAEVRKICEKEDVSRTEDKELNYLFQQFEMYIDQ